MLKIFSVNYSWQEEVKDKVCEDSQEYLQDVSSQLECQKRCIEKIGCVGITYSYKNEYFGRYCFVCMDDNLITAVNGFGFYRKPGIVDV